jgi:aquaporin Z
MGLTAVGIVYSPWGKQSGAHLNPSFTLTFLRLGKVEGKDAMFYVMAQFIGGAAGVWLAAKVVGAPISHPSVNYAVTVPGSYGPSVAFWAEFIISFLMMTVVLRVSNHAQLARYTGLFAGALVAIYISLEAPLSGMSMNPARTLGSAFFSQEWTGLWIYFTAPPLGMLFGAEVYLAEKGKAGINCAKLHHQNNKRCIFCDYRNSDPERGTKVSIRLTDQMSLESQPKVNIPPNANGSEEFLQGQ